VGWAEVLTEMESRLADVGRQLSGAGSPPTAFALPADLGPLPPALAERARHVLADTRAAQVAVEAARDRLGAVLRQPAPVRREPAAYVDTWM